MPLTISGLKLCETTLIRKKGELTTAVVRLPVLQSPKMKSKKTSIAIQN
jgi:hypothetical protein